MSLSAGTRLDQYEILSPLGSGGMGEVYRARDTRLGREVAIKVLPDRTAFDATALERFEREAKALAALSHPNILTIFDFGTDKGVTYAVMELLDGETLRSKIHRASIPPAKIIDIGLSIAEGLGAAHSRGIVHRDLKPENVFITSSGGIKILDFGLARLEPVATPEAESKVATVAGTEPGTVLGTIGYMSPEQVRGLPVDSRTDIFALGCILYEMATGKCPFARTTAADTMAAILNYDPPEVVASGKEIPPELDRVILHCLEKNVEDRFQSARDLSFDLKEIGSGIRLTRPHKAASPPHSAIGKLVIAAFIICFALAGLWWFTRMSNLPGSNEKLPVAVADFINETGEKELDGLSGMLITSLEQSKRLAVMTRSRMLDVLKQMNVEDTEHIDERLGREICKRSNVNALIIASIRKFDQLYTIDLKVLDPAKNEYLFTTKQQGTGKASVPDMIDKLSEQTRRGLKEKAVEIQTASRKVTEVTTSNLQAYQHYFKGEELIQKLNFKDAEDEFAKAIAIDPNFALAYLRMGYAISWSNLDRAKPYLDNSLRLQNNLPEKEKMFVRAYKAYADRDLDHAMKELRQLLALYPQEKEAIFTLGDWLYHFGELQKAEGEFEKVLSLDPNFERATQHLIWTYKGLNKYDKAIQTSKAYVDKTGSDEAFQQLFSALREAGQYDDALQLTSEAEKLFPGALEIKRAKAEIYTAQLQYEKAKNECNLILADKRPEMQIDGCGCLTDIYVLTGRYREAVRMKQRQIDVELESRELNNVTDHYADMAYILLWGLDDKIAADEALEKSLQYLKETERVPHSLFDTLLFAGKINEASNVAHSHMWGHRSFTNQHIDAARKYQSGDFQGALKEYTFLSERGFPMDKAFALYRTAMIQTELKDYDSAIRNLEQFLSLTISKIMWESPRALFALASLYDTKGEQKKATEYYKKFLEVWRLADRDRPEVIEARKKVS